MTKLVPGICTQCGSTLEVNPEQDAAICQYCGTPFIVDKAIEKYTIQSVNSMNISNAVIQMGPSADNLAKRGKQFEDNEDFNKAEEYYNKALDIDVDNQLALDGMKRLEIAKVVLGYYQQGLECEKMNQLANAKSFFEKALNSAPSSKKYKSEIERIDELIRKKTTLSFESRCDLGNLLPNKGTFCFDMNGVHFYPKNNKYSDVVISANQIQRIFSTTDYIYPNPGPAFSHNAIGVEFINNGRKKKLTFYSANAKLHISIIDRIMRGIY